jgi:anaerobic carbon-monoxide dehydrogenase iron sulfur subunit
VLSFDLAKCSGCRRCEVSCAFAHSQRVGRNASRIKVVKIEDLGLDCPVVCQACKERYCAECPEGAIQGGSLGQIKIDLELCTGCGTCESLCPVGAIELYEERPLACDLCSGDPRCVRACTMGALTYKPQSKDVVSLKDYHEGSDGLSPEDKRVRFALRVFESLRKSWISTRRA